MQLPDPRYTKNFAVWVLLFALFVESVWTINYLSPKPVLALDSLVEDVTENLPNYIEDNEPAPTEEYVPEATITIHSGSYFIKKGDEATFTVSLDTAGKTTDGISLKLRYDKDTLEIIDADKSKAGIQTTNLNLFPNALINEAGNGSIQFNAVSDPEGPYVSGSADVIEFKVHAKKTGEAFVEAEYEPGLTTESNVSDHDNPGKDMLGNVANTSITIN